MPLLAHFQFSLGSSAASFSYPFTLTQPGCTRVVLVSCFSRQSHSFTLALYWYSFWLGITLLFTSQGGPYASLNFYRWCCDPSLCSIPAMPPPQPVSSPVLLTWSGHICVIFSNAPIHSIVAIFNQISTSIDFVIIFPQLLLIFAFPG